MHFSYNTNLAQMEVKAYRCWQPYGDGFDFTRDQGGARKDCESVEGTFHFGGMVALVWRRDSSTGGCNSGGELELHYWRRGSIVSVKRVVW